jgi:hypothetical protein
MVNGLKFSILYSLPELLKNNKEKLRYLVPFAFCSTQGETVPNKIIFTLFPISRKRNILYTYWFKIFNFVFLAGIVVHKKRVGFKMGIIIC